MAAPMTRRRLLRLSLLSGVALTAAGGLLGGEWLAAPRRYAVPPGVRGKLRALSAKEYRLLAAVAARILDGVEPALRDGGGGVALWADGYVAGLPAEMQGDVRALLQLFEHAPAFSGHFSRFTALPAEAQDAVLRDWAESGLALRRQGFQALKSLCCLAYYQDPRSFAAIGYSGPML